MTQHHKSDVLFCYLGRVNNVDHLADLPEHSEQFVLARLGRDLLPFVFVLFLQGLLHLLHFADAEIIRHDLLPSFV